MNKALSLLLIFFSIGILLIPISEINLRIIELNLIGLYIYILFYLYRIKKNLSILFIFLVSFGIFNLSKIIISLLYKEEWTRILFFKEYIINEKIQIEMIQIVLIHLVGVFIGIILYNRKKRIKKMIKSDLNLKKICRFLMLISIIPLIYKYKVELEFIRNNGYLSLYNGVFINHQFPIWTKGWNILFTYSYYLYLASIPTEKEFKKYTLLFISLKLISALKGGRTEFATDLLFLISYYTILYKRKIRWKALIIAGVGGGVFYFIGNLRANNLTVSNIKLIEKIKNFILEQGMSFYILSINKEYLNEYLNPKLQIIAPFLDEIQRLKNPKLFLTQSLELLDKSYNLNYHLSYKYIPNEFLKGAGIGSNYLAEVYNFGGILFCGISGIILSYIILLLEDNLFKSRFTFYISIPIILNLFISPRGNFFPFLFRFYPYIIFYVFILGIIKILKVIQKNNLEMRQE